MPFQAIPEDSQAAIDKLRAYGLAQYPAGPDETGAFGLGPTSGGLEVPEQRRAFNWTHSPPQSPDSLAAQAKIALPTGSASPLLPGQAAQPMPLPAPLQIISPHMETLGSKETSSGVSLSQEGKAALKASGEATKNATKYIREAAADRATLMDGVADQNIAQAKANELAQRNLSAERKEKEDQAMALSDRAIASAANFKPTDYWQEKGAANQIGSAIAMAMGAYGAAINHGPNYAMQIIDNAINRHVAAQDAKQRKLTGAAEMARGNVGLVRGQTASEQQALAYNTIQAAEVAKAMVGKSMVGVNSKEALAGAEQTIAHLDTVQAQAQAAVAPHFSSTTDKVFVPGGVAGQDNLKELTKEEQNAYSPELGGIILGDPAEAGKLKRKLGLMNEYKERIDELKGVITESPADSLIPGREAYVARQRIVGRLQEINSVMGEMGVLNSNSDTLRALKIAGSSTDIFTNLKDLEGTQRQNYDSAASQARSFGVRDIPTGFKAPKLIGGDYGHISLRKTEKLK